jgi:hypothetical protein
LAKEVYWQLDFFSTFGGMLFGDAIEGQAAAL